MILILGQNVHLKDKQGQTTADYDNCLLNTNTALNTLFPGVFFYCKDGFATIAKGSQVSSLLKMQKVLTQNVICSRSKWPLFKELS